MTNRLFRIRQGLAAVMIVGAAALLSGCLQGHTSEKPPIHLNPNMDSQNKFKAQSENDFFANGSSMRPLVEGTVARGWLQQDSPGPVALDYGESPLTGNAVYQYYTGRVSAQLPDEYVKKSPVAVTDALLQRGQDRFNIYCAACHGKAGDGRGPVTERASGRSMLHPPSYTSDRIMNMPDGQIFDTITNGSAAKVMPSYKVQVPVEDRWAIIAYVRALQLSQHATAESLPPGDVDKAKQQGSD